MIGRITGPQQPISRSAQRAATPQQEESGPVDAFQATSQVAFNPVKKGLGWLGKGVVLALVASLSLAGTPALAAGLPSRADMMTASGQMHPDIQPGGVNFDKSPNQVRQEAANSVTQDQLKPGQPAYRPADTQQSGKRYYKPELEQAIANARQSGTLTPKLLAELMTRHESHDGGPNINWGSGFRYCVAMNSSNLKCASALPNQISYKLLSCQYKNADGKVETVLHRSYQHQYTNSMQRGVCGGNRLESKMVDGFSQWGPVQTSPSGAALYLNPGNIIATLPAR